MDTSIRVEQRDAVAVISLNRPDKLNAFTPDMQRALQDVLTGVERNEEIRAVVLTGEGRAFCAGQDLESIQHHPDLNYGEVLKQGYNPLILKLTKLEKPVIAAINGVAAGAGVSLALACDFRIASERASLIQSFVNIGLIPDSGSTWLLPRIIGLTKAIELMFLGEKISAVDAARIGLIHRTCPPEQLLPEAMALAERLGKLPTKAIGMTKRALYKGLGNTLEQSLEYEAQLQELAGRTNDHQEGLRAFFEKRTPEYQGR
ncbi:MULTISPECIES: enoyl-CoA hydratase-related protein [Alicyclobacillus]|uniref:Enoyl-CoA hydratase-related protein n=1 Tax=Alicyclobacillus acidoterrestris (strain ATCC 49025 / DSM 3922 / CIP 106132 / NCIMB 13137 / GD3B) TaxID=1356854 RepID=T0CJY1_ALIAG|nr:MULTISPECIES: enoyl-CoA hydratase-related protein [Alicyclobacillus]EPZ52825.1 hypothetical protein N007_19520 [Alicyclobacillus acidoterrestris ATCC 49025]UNO48722.1 enoyl-CoA hydratase-related protein [Alicyclobacillus acidoterrestris]